MTPPPDRSEVGKEKSAMDLVTKILMHLGETEEAEGEDAYHVAYDDLKRVLESCLEDEMEQLSALRDRAARMEKALRRLMGAVEACAVSERGGPPVNWEAVNASQDAARHSLAHPEKEKNDAG